MGPRTWVDGRRRHTRSLAACEGGTPFVKSSERCTRLKEEFSLRSLGAYLVNSFATLQATLFVAPPGESC